MAEKKSWRDYYDDLSKNEASNGKVTSGDNGSKGWRSYLQMDAASIAGGHITKNVNAWLQSHNDYISSYQERNSGRKYSYEDGYVSDSSDWLNTVNQKKSALDTEADSILAYMDQYKGYLDAKWVESVKKTLTDARGVQGQILTAATKDNEWWNSFANEELVKQYGSAENAYKAYQRYDGYSKKYDGQTSDDIMKALEALEDGEEKDWLSSHRASVYHDEMLKYDTETAGKELAALENVLGEYDRLEDYYNKYSANPNAYSGEDSARIKELASIFAQYKQKFGSKKDLEKRVHDARLNLNNAKRIQKGAELASVADSTSKNYDPEFDQYSQYVDQDEDLFLGFLPGYKDVIHDSVNNNVDSSRVAMGQAWDWISGSELKRLDAVKYMNDEERSLYNYYFSKHGYDAAEEYLDGIIEELNGRQALKSFEAFEDKWMLEQVFAIAAGLDQFESGIKSLFSTDDYIPQSSTQQLSGLIREDLGDAGFKLPDWMGGASISQGIYDLTSTTFNMAPSILASTVVGAFNPVAGAAVGNVLMGASAAGNAYQEALNLGYDKDQARTYSTLVGASEVGLQYLLGGIGKLGGKLSGKAAASLASKFDSAYARLAVQYGMNMLSEGGEEYLQEILTPVFKNLALGTDEEINLISEEAIYSFLLGAISSGFMEGTGISSESGKGLIGNLIDMSSKNEANIQAATQYGDYTEALIKEGLNSDPNSESYQMAQMFKRKTDKGKAMTGYEIRQQVEANEAQFAVENYNDAVSAAEKQLTELGESKDVTELAKLVAKKATGQELTRKEKSTLVNSQYGSKVAKDMTDAYNLTYKPLEERVGTDSRFNVSDTGKTIVRESGTEIDTGSLEVATVGDGQMTFKMDDGTEVSAGDIDFADEDQSYLVSAVSNIENITPAAATAIMHDLVDTSKPLGEQLNGIDEAYTYGFHGYSVADLKSGNYAPSLTNTQMMSAYELGKSARKISDTASDAPRVRMRTEAQAKLTKAQQKAKQKARIESDDVEVYFQDGKSVVKFDERTDNVEYDEKRMAAVNTAKFLSKLGIGGKYYFYKSYKKDGKRVYRDSDGNEVDAPNGMYMEDGTIWIDLNAGENGQGTALFTMGHELTHFIKAQSAKQFKVLCDLVEEAFSKTDMSMHKRVLAKLEFLESIRGKDVSYNEAYEEVVADAMSTMLTDGSFHEKIMEIKVRDKGLFNTIKRFFEQMIEKFRKSYAELTPDQQDARDIRAMKDMFDKIQTAFAEALVEASDNFNAITAVETETLTDAGIGFDAETKSVYSLRYSTAYKDTVQVGKKSFDTEKIAQIVAKGTGRSIEDARKWVRSEMTIANMVMANPEFLDFQADNRYEAIKKNSDYPQGTVDLSNLCPKREEFTAMFDKLQKAYPDKLFTAQDIADMRKILAKNDITVACGACFVEDRRQLVGEIAETFIGMWTEAVESGKPLQKTNAAGQKSDLLVTKALAKQYGLNAGSKIMAEDTYIPNQYDLTTYEGFKLLEKNHPTIAMAFNRYNNSRGQQSARLIEGRAEYNRQILGWSDAKVRSVNNNGGLRIFSFSDFEVVHLLDLVQVIIDCSARGVKIQGYTKIPAFAKLVRDTGIKLNRSLIPKGDYGYHMENGKVVQDYDTTEGININDENFIDESSNPNVGNIVIGINQTQISAAMLDPFIDYIIPFHSNKAKAILEKLGTGKWVNYKESQHEKDISTGTASKHNVNIYTEVINKYHPKNKVEFVEAFLKECKRQGKIPRYAEFLNVDENGDYAYREGYHKLLVDFKMFDADGNILPQGNITPNLNEGFMKDLLNAEVDKKQNYKFPQEVYDDINKKFGEKHSDRQTGLENRDGTRYSNRNNNHFFADNVFPSGMIHSSVTHWANRKDVQIGDSRLEEYKGSYYRVEKVAGTDFGYQITNKYTDQDYKEDLKEYGEIDGKESVQERVDRVDALYRETEEYGHGRYHAGASGTEYGREDSSLLPMGQDSTGRRGNSGRTEGNRQGGLRDQRQTGRRSEPSVTTLRLNELSARAKWLRERIKSDRVSKEKKTEYRRELKQIRDEMDKLGGGYFLSRQEKYSDRDSTGKELTKEQQAYFASSVVRDADGRLMVMYHGTANGGAFTIFDGDQLGNEARTSQVGQGFYFTNAKAEAESYTKNVDIYGRTSKGKAPYLHEVYLNITNPLNVAEDTLNLDDVKAVYGDGTYDYFFSDWIPFYLNRKSVNGEVLTEAAVQALSKEEKVSLYVDYLAQLGTKELLSNMVRAFPYGKQSELLAAMQNRMGYDGIVEEYAPGEYQYVAFSSEQIKSVDNKEPTADKDIRYSERGDGTSNRSLLANAFEGITMNSNEYKLIQQYKGYVAELDSLDAKLSELNAEIRKIRFGKGEYDAEKLARLEGEAKKIAEAINKYDKRLLSLEASEPLRKIIERERNAERQKAKENAQKLKADYKLRNEVKQSEILREVRETRAALRNQKNDAAVMEKEFIRIAKAYERLDAKAETRAGKDAKTIANLKDALKDEAKKHREDQKTWEAEFNRLMREYEAAGRSIDKLEAKIERQKANARAKIESRERTELRHKIRKAVRDLDKILNRGNKKSNVKEGMKDFVAQALASAEVLFMDNYSNEDMVRNGVEVKVDANENRLLDETQRLLRQRDDLYSVGAVRGEIDDVIVGDTSGFEDRMAESERLDRKISKNMALLRSVFERERARINETTVSSVLDDLAKAYRKLGTSDDLYIRNVTDENVYQHLLSLSERMEGAIVKDMKLSQLEELYKAYKMVLHTVRNANNLFVKGKMESIDKMAEKITSDFNSRKIPDKTMAIVARNLSNKLGWDYEKLYYALDRIGSEAFTELVMNIANSENIVMQDVMEATAFRDEMVEKYDFNDWDVDKELDREFLDNTGKKFKMTLGQLMALYAYSRREGAWDHIEYGGFVFGEAALTNPRPADSYKLNKEQCEAITGMLTKEQKGYVEDMQKYLSETMGEKGNEVSMLLYGIKMFGEKNYFPIHVAGQFKAQANESQAKAAAGFSSMSNAGFTHAQNPNAKAPFVLEGFNEIWVDHVNEMSRYHGTVPALEDMRRVMNRSSYSEATAESMAIKQLMENSFGKEAVEYFDNLYREANSGAITDKLQKTSKKLLSLFRKNSVAYSLSVLVQQPTSIIRAFAMVDKKYFGVKGFGTITAGVAKAVSDKWTKAHTKAYNEMLKYAPGVTMAKEIGGFDTATGGSIRSYLLDTNKSFRQKVKTDKHGKAVGLAKAALDKVDNNAIANLPNLADKIAWIEIWNACKRETVATHKDLAPNSEEFMQAVGERFTEVIRATQVYDSIFAKSPMLKSKNLYVQMLVSFMNEPNTVANMVESTVRDFIKGDVKKGTKKAATLIYGVAAGALIKSIIYAMRDDDEDETFIEKYIEAVTGSLIDDFNPLNYIPVVRDAVSLAQGYDVERADMAIVADALDAVNKVIKNGFTDTDDMTEEQLIEFDKKCTEANWKLVESLAAFVGIPVKNIRREYLAVVNTGKTVAANEGYTSLLSAWDKVYDEFIGSIPFIQAKNTKQDKLYRAIVNGDKAYLDRLKSTYKTDSAYESAVRKALRENDHRIHAAAQARYEGKADEYKRIFKEIQKEGKFSFDDIMSAINSEESAIRNGVEPDKVTSDYTASGFVEAMILGDTGNAQAMRDDIIATHIANGKTEKEAEEAFASSVATGIREAYSAGLLDDTGAENMLQEYAGKDEEEAASKVSYWAFCEKYPKYKDVFSEANVAKYHEFGEPAEVPVDVYAQFITGTKGLADIKDEWGDVEVSKREQVLDVIHSLPLTWQQKDALYLAYGYAESKIWDVPW